MLSDRLKENPKLLSDTRFSARDKQSFKVYEMEEQIGQLWEKRFTYCVNDYNRELALICNDSIHRYNQEWRRYVRWKVAYDKHQKEAQLCFQSERRSIDRDTRSDNRIKFSDLDEPRGGIKLSPFLSLLKSERQGGGQRKPRLPSNFTRRGVDKRAYVRYTVRVCIFYL